MSAAQTLYIYIYRTSEPEFCMPLYVNNFSPSALVYRLLNMLPISISRRLNVLTNKKYSSVNIFAGVIRELIPTWWKLPQVVFRVINSVGFSLKRHPNLTSYRTCPVWPQCTLPDFPSIYSRSSLLFYLVIQQLWEMTWLTLMYYVIIIIFDCIFNLYSVFE